MHLMIGFLRNKKIIQISVSFQSYIEIHIREKPYKSNRRKIETHLFELVSPLLFSS